MRATNAVVQRMAWALTNSEATAPAMTVKRLKGLQCYKESCFKSIIGSGFKFAHAIERASISLDMTTITIGDSKGRGMRKLKRCNVTKGAALTL